jgi:hypothetical protein
VDEFKTERAVYTPHDFVLWQEHEMLVISPKFQRRGVWRPAARSFFIDTMLREMTVPPLYFRMTQNQTATKAIREVVDGQQRIRSVLDFIKDDGFRLSKTLRATWAGKKFNELPEVQRNKISYFSFPVEIFKGLSDQQVLEVFSRLNMNGIPLNKQELRNGKYFGFFKQTALALALVYYEFWRNNRIFSDQSIARMLEVELTSELLIAGREGMQDKKKTIDSFYDKWENAYSSREADEKRFRDTFAAISDTFSGGELAGTAFRRPPLFYTLYCVVYHHMFGLPGIQRQSPKKSLTADRRESLKDAALKLSNLIAEAKDPGAEIPAKYKAFLAACQRQTDNINPRKTRFDGLFDQAF